MLERPFAPAMRQLKAAGLRPTRQRLALAKLLLDTAPRHVTAEELFQEARAAGIPVSLATVYNTLHQFTAAGIMSEVVVGSGQSYFDTNPTSHYHYFDPATGEIIDIPQELVRFLRLPSPPPGKVIERIDVVVRIRNADRAQQPAARRQGADSLSECLPVVSGKDA
jgi:Fur family iron response transcriptional regulator